MLKFSKTEVIKNLILIGILVLVVLVFDLPMYDRIKSVYSQLEEKKETYALQFKQGNSYDKSLKDYKDYQAKLPSLDETFLPVGKELQLITRLEELATRHNLSQAINLGSRAKDQSDRIKVLELDIDLAGNYRDLANYIAELEENRFEVNIKGLELKKSGQAVLQASLHTFTYWLEKL